MTGLLSSLFFGDGSVGINISSLLLSIGEKSSGIMGIAESLTLSGFKSPGGVSGLGEHLRLSGDY